MAPLGRVMVLRISGFCGMVGPLTSFSLILAAISRSPWFSWTGNYLSDLGANPDVAVLFDSGLIIGGALTAIFAIGLKTTLPGLTRGGVGVITLFLAAVALCCVGIFPERTGIVHISVAEVFFVLSIITLLLIGSAMMRQPSERNLGLLIFITGLFTCVPFIALVVIVRLTQAGGAIPEFLVALGALVCFIILAVRMFRQAPHQVRG